MFSQWAVEVLKRLTTRFEPKPRFAHPVRLLTDLLLTISVFFWFNRRPLSNYSASFWSQLLYLVQLFKVVYTLRFLLVELVFRELRTFFCFISPLASKLAIVKKWQTADPCVLKVVNLAFFLVFILLNVFIAYSIEYVGRATWAWLTTAKKYGINSFFLPKPLVFAGDKKRRKPQKSPRYRIRRQKKASKTRPLISFWPRSRSAAICVHPPGVSSSNATMTPSVSVRDLTSVPLSLEHASLNKRTTRSGRNY